MVLVRISAVLMAAIGLFGFTAGAFAQLPDWTQPARYGSINLQAGFQPDPYNIQVQSGGNGQSNHLGPGCVGEIDFSKPDVTLYYSAGQYQMSIAAQAAADITLVIRAPNGSFYCNDDYQGTNPAVVFGNPQSGEYDIWVGTYGGGIRDATLMVTERTPFNTGGNQGGNQGGGSQGGGNTPNWQAQPRYTTFNLSAGFQPDPQSIYVQAGGGGSVNHLAPGCVGVIDFSRPDVDLNYQAGQYILSIWAEGGNDLTLVVYDPVGQWYCNDDFRGLDPAIRFNNPRSGNYNIWVGTHGGLSDSYLYITERQPFSR
ncbi:MAG: hypothetical protein RIM33_10460 [Alphaproteobacteria bacterium]